MESFSSLDKGKEQTTDQLTFKVGEREFNAESAATKIGAADDHIRRIEEENAAYKTKLATLEAQAIQSTKIDDALSQLEKQRSQESQSVPVTAGHSEEQIGAIAEQRVKAIMEAQRLEADKLTATNLSASTFQQTGDTLRTQYGEGLDAAMAAKAGELGLAPQALFAMAQSPDSAKILLHMMKASTPVSQTVPNSTLSGFNGSAPESLYDHKIPLTSGSVLDALNKANG